MFNQANAIRAQLLANKAQPESAFCLGGTVNVAARWAIVIPLWSNGFWGH